MIIDTDTLMKLYVEYEWDAECPTEFSAYDTISFCSRHVNFKEPTDELIKEIEEKVEQGKAFWLDCYQHSGTCWSRSGTGYQCRWDTAKRGGVLLVTDDYVVGDTENADRFLEIYNQWCNGEVYAFHMNVDDEHVDGLCSIYEPDEALHEIVAALKHHKPKQIMLEGEALSLIQPELSEKIKELNIEVVDL